MHRRIHRFSACLLLAALLTGPAIAAPSADVATGWTLAPSLELVAGWWSGFTGGLESLFAANRHTVDPNGEPATSTSAEDSDFEAGSQNRHTVDPDG